MEVILSLVLILVLSYFVVWVGKKIKVPDVVMLIALGLLFNVSLLHKSFITGNSSVLMIFGNIGLFAMMFLAGVEISWSQLYKEKKNSVFIATFASLTPFFMSFIVFSLIGFPKLTAAMIGVSMAITAEATSARVLLDLKKLKTKISAALMGAGITDDFIGLGLFVIIASLFGAWSNKQLLTLGAVASFFAGIILNRYIRKIPQERSVLEKIIVFGLVPFFFIAIGINVDFGSLVLNPLIVLLMIAIAMSGKIIGTFLTKHWTHFRNEQLWVIGWGMNSRGAIGLALSIIALQMGLLTKPLYSGIVIMALTTTLVFPFALTHLIKKDPKVMN